MGGHSVSHSGWQWRVMMVWMPDESYRGGQKVCGMSDVGSFVLDV